MKIESIPSGGDVLRLACISIPAIEKLVHSDVYQRRPAHSNFDEWDHLGVRLAEPSVQRSDYELQICILIDFLWPVFTDKVTPVAANVSMNRTVSPNPSSSWEMELVNAQL